MQMANRLYDGNDGNDGLGNAGGFVAATDDVNGREGTYPIVDSDNTFRIVGNQSQTMLNGVKTRLATVG